jgi:hypothetical protein
MPFYYLLPALAGQTTDLPAGKLAFNPPGVAAGQAWSFPWFVAGAGGSVARDAAGKCTLTLVYGALALPAGGLTVAASTYPAALSLSPGQSVSW